MITIVYGTVYGMVYWRWKKKQENTVYFVHVLHVYVVCCNQFYHKCVFFFGFRADIKIVCPVMRTKLGCSGDTKTWWLNMETFNCRLAEPFQFEGHLKLPRLFDWNVLSNARVAWVLYSVCSALYNVHFCGWYFEHHMTMCIFVYGIQSTICRRRWKTAAFHFGIIEGRLICNSLLYHSQTYTSNDKQCNKNHQCKLFRKEKKN